MACPVVGTSAGAIPDTVPRGAGMLVAPDNPAAFAQALRPRHRGSERAAAAAQAARAAAGSLPTWQQSPRRFFRARLRPWHERIFRRLGWRYANHTTRARAMRRCSRRRRRLVQTKRFSVRIVDLACGTGSALRALGPRLAARQNWRLADNDLDLLAARRTCLRQGRTISTVALDLTRDLEAALEGPVDLVDTSALLDLVSETWLERLAVGDRVARSISVYAALSYDGRIELAPARSTRCVNCRRSQRTPAHRQRLRPRTRAGGGGRCDRTLRIARLFRNTRRVRLGHWAA